MKLLTAFASLSLVFQTSVTSARPQADDFIVKGLVDVEPAFESFEGDMFAGVLPIDPFGSTPKNYEEEPGHLMFWYFDTWKPTVDDSLIVWFNGGKKREGSSFPSSASVSSPIASLFA